MGAAPSNGQHTGLLLLRELFERRFEPVARHLVRLMLWSVALD